MVIDGLVLQHGDASTNVNDPGYGGGLLDLGSNVALDQVTVTANVGCETAGCAFDQGLGGGITYSPAR